MLRSRAVANTHPEIFSNWWEEVTIFSTLMTGNEQGAKILKNTSQCIRIRIHHKADYDPPSIHTVTRDGLCNDLVNLPDMPL